MLTIRVRSKVRPLCEAVASSSWLRQSASESERTRRTRTDRARSNPSHAFDRDMHPLSLWGGVCQVGTWRLELDSASATIAEVKAQIEKLYTVPPHQQTLCLDQSGATTMADSETLAQHGLMGNGAMAYLLVRERFRANESDSRETRCHARPRPSSSVARGSGGGDVVMGTSRDHRRRVHLVL